MASGLPDMGKMIGPLPLGAWVAVVGGGLGFMVYQRRQADVVSTAASDTGTALDDTSGVPGVGVGGSYTYTGDTTTATDSTGDDAENTDLDAWGRALKNYLIGQGYNAAIVDSAVSKYLSGAGGYSTQEFALLTIGLTHMGAPPTNLPAPVLPGPSTSTTGTAGGTTKTTHKYTMKDGYYVLLPNMSHFAVHGNKQYYVRPATYQALKKRGVKFTAITAASVLFKLPPGGDE